MSSRKLEDIHVSDLERLITKSGLKCVRPAAVISIPEHNEIEEETAEEMAALEEEPTKEETKPEEEEEKPVPIEEKKTEKPKTFPTPSLRRVLPEDIRNIEKENRIHVLPEEFKTDIDADQIPTIAVTPAQKYIDKIASLVGCSQYKSSMAEYWFLDTLANLLRRAQEDGMDKSSQAVLMIWFCEWMKEMQYFDAADRHRMMRRFKENMLAAASTLAIDDRLPTPSKAGVFYNKETLTKTSPAANSSMISDRNDSLRVAFTSENRAYQCSLQDLINIIHYIFDLFSTDYQFNLVRSVFTLTPDYLLIDAPHYLQTPKTIYPSPLKNRPKSPSKDSKKRQPDVAGTQVAGISESALNAYNALMELKLKETIEITEREAKEEEEWTRKSHILPLSFAMDPSFLDKYWPPKSPETSFVSAKTGRKAKKLR